MCQEATAHSMTNSHLLLQDFEYVKLATLDEALALLAEFSERSECARLLAGGTYLLVQMKQERARPEVVVDIRHLSGLSGATWIDDELHIGAMTSIRDTAQLAPVQRHYEALAEACAAFGSMQIQMSGTLGGNVCNGSPASDTLPALLAFDAQLVLAHAGGERILPLSKFLLGPGRTALRSDEVLTQVVLAPPEGCTGSAFIKISRVAADLAKVSGAAVLVRDGERVVDCRLAFGSVAPTAIRAESAEAFLRGKPFSPELALAAGEIVMNEVAPIDDVRSTAWYRREVCKAVTHDLLLAAWDRAAEMPEFTPIQADLSSTAMRPRAGLRSIPGQKVEISLRVNGEQHQLWVSPNELLLNVLRDRLELTGSKYGCGIGECGACTVLLEGRPVLSCLTLAVAVDGADVLTVEGLHAPEGGLHTLQEAFLDHQAFQCGFCTPGILMMSKALLDDLPAPGEEDVREYLRGNRCRCTGFASIVRAVLNCVDSPDSPGSPG